MNWVFEALSYGFMQRALVVGVAISFLAALLGVTMVLRRNSMIGDGLSHVAFGAFAVALVLGVAPLYFAIPVVILVSFIIMRVGKRHNGDTAIALLSASSLAIGTVAISVSKGVNIDLNSYLFGSILSLSWGEVWTSVVLAGVVAIFYVVMHHRIFAITFDEEFARVIGLKTRMYDAVFAIICSVVVVFGMRLLGALLISSLIIFPVLIARQFARSFKKVVMGAAVVSVVNFVVGLLFSYGLSTPTGATVVCVNLVVLIVMRMARN